MKDTSAIDAARVDDGDFLAMVTSLVFLKSEPYNPKQVHRARDLAEQLVYLRCVR